MDASSTYLSRFQIELYYRIPNSMKLIPNRITKLIQNSMNQVQIALFYRVPERTRYRLEGGVNRRFKNNYGIGLKECGIKLMFIFFKHKT
jgi:hypothetical protein